VRSEFTVAPLDFCNISRRFVEFEAGAGLAARASDAGIPAPRGPKRVQSPFVSGTVAVGSLRRASLREIGPFLVHPLAHVEKLE
jgi:hypothetical protein